MQKKYKIEKEKLDEILEARKQKKDKRENKRLQAVELRILGYTNEEMVHILRVHKRTITRWIQTYVEHGIERLRNKPAVGNHRNLTLEEEAKLLKSFEERARKGQPVTVQEIKEAYLEKNEIFKTLADVVNRLCDTINLLTQEKVKRITHRDWIKMAK